MSVPACRVRKAVDYPDERIRLMKKFCEKLFPCPVELVVERGETPTVSAVVEKRGKKAVLRVNVDGKLLKRAFELGEAYVEALIEHEAKHLNDFEWDYTSLPLPRSLKVVATQGAELRRLLESYLNESYADALADAASIALMSGKNAERYLKLLCEVAVLLLIQGREDLKIAYYFPAAISETFFRLPDCSFIVERTVEDEFDRRIYEKLKRIFSQVANGVEAGVKRIDVRRESIELAELLFNQPFPLTKEVVVLG